MWPFWLHNNTNIHLDLRQIDCYFMPVGLRPHKIITLNIVVDEYLLKIAGKL